MKTLRIMSIIGIIWFSLSLLFLIIFIDLDTEASIGWGMLGLVYAIAFSIVSLVNLKRTKQNSYQELLNLNELKEKGILDDDEFQALKKDLLSNNSKSVLNL